MNTFLIDLFESFEKNKINYCHFKSNNNLKEALEGIDDLDLLISKKDEKTFLRVLSSFGFVLSFDRNQPKTPHVYHFWGLDEESGKLIHLHVYFKLITGGSVFKNHLVSFEEMLLHESNSLDEFKVYTPSKEADLIFFVVRKFIEQPSLVENFLYYKDIKGIKSELTWLTEDIDYEKLNNLLDTWVPYIPKSFFLECLNILLDNKSKFFRRILLGLKMRTFFTNTVSGTIWVELLRLKLFFGAFFSNRLGFNRKDRYTFPGGLLISFVGPEACGKSTLSNALFKWLQERFDVFYIHLGKPEKNWRTLPVWYLIYIYSTIKPLVLNLSKRGINGKKENIDDPINMPHPLVSYLDSIDRRYYIKKYFRKCMQGSIIITDRYPNEFIDGPRITPDSSIKSFLSDLEKKNYLKLPTPDIVFKIHSPIEVTLERNSKRDIPDPEDFVRVRYQLASKVDFKTTTQIDIDTTKGLEETIINLKKFFWFRNTSV